jgi:hypothetical protein
MKNKHDTHSVIEDLIAATLSAEASARERHLLRENLRNLVRLAKVEQIVEIKDNVKKLTGAIEAHNARRRAKAVLLAQRLPDLIDRAQSQFEFKQ